MEKEKEKKRLASGGGGDGHQYVVSKEIFSLFLSPALFLLFALPHERGQQEYQGAI